MLLYRRSIRFNLMLLVAACLLPALAVCAHLIAEAYRLQRERTYRDAVLVARNMVAEIDGQLIGIESGLRVLSTSSDLEAGDLGSFYARAQNALKFQIVGNYALTDRDGRQVLNTIKPFGSPLPTSGAAARLQDVFTTGKPLITDLFDGTLIGAPLAVVAVPVFRDERVAMTLNAALSAERLGKTLKTDLLPPGWIAALLDGSGRIVARSRDAERFVGQRAVEPLVRRVMADREGTLDTLSKDGIPVFTAFSRSSVSSWSVAVGAPTETLVGEVNRSIALLATVVLAALAFGSWMALYLSRRISASVSGLIEPALALGSGRPVEVRKAQLPETKAVGEALVRASHMLARAQHLAHHDGLTGLCNRVLFDEIARRELSAAVRVSGRLAVLAIDLDGFKAVNDLHGHAAGDEVLKEAAQRIAALVRESDTVARMGGDEFVVLLPGADTEQAMGVARLLVEALSAPYACTSEQVSASIGAASFPHSASTLQSLLAQSDRALYEAKRLGRNRAAAV